MWKASRLKQDEMKTSRLIESTQSVMKRKVKKKMSSLMTENKQNRFKACTTNKNKWF